MRDRRVRTAFVGLTLLFPFLMAATGSPQPLSPRTVLTVLAVEAVLAGGLLAASRERRLLLAERASPAAAAPASSAPSFPHVRVAGRRPAVRATTR